MMTFIKGFLKLRISEITNRQKYAKKLHNQFENQIGAIPSDNSTRWTSTYNLL